MILSAGRFGVSIERRASGLAVEFRSNVSTPDRWLVEYAGGHPTASGQTITERTAVQLTGVYCAVDLISNALATAKLSIWKREPGGGRTEATDHPLFPILNSRPNPEMTSITFRNALSGHVLLWGNAYVEIERNGGGQVVNLWPLRPDRTFPERMPNGQLRYVCRSEKGSDVYLAPSEILHWMGYSYDGLRGLSPIALHRESLGITMATQDYGARFFGNDSRPGGVLTHPNKLDDKATKRLKASWEEAQRGSAQAHRVAILEEGMAWQSIGMPNEDAQFLQTRVFQLSETSRVYHVPLHMLAEMSRATFSNIEHQAIDFIRHGVLPWGGKAEAEYERKLLSPAEQKIYYVEHNFESQMRGDLKSRYDAYAVAWMNGWRSADDIGELENWNKQPNGQGKTYWVPVNQQTVDRGINPPAPPAAGGGAPDPNADPDADDPPKPDDSAQGRAILTLVRTYAPAVEHIGIRIARKETAALEKRNLSYEEHEKYVAEAYVPVFEGLSNSMGALLGLPAEHSVERVKFARQYVDGLGHRHCQLRAVAGWVDDTRGRAFQEASRFAEQFRVWVQKKKEAA